MSEKDSGTFSHAMPEPGQSKPHGMEPVKPDALLDCMDGAVKRKRRPTIQELEAVLSDPRPRRVRLLPNGEVEAVYSEVLVAEQILIAASVKWLNGECSEELSHELQAAVVCYLSALEAPSS